MSTTFEIWPAERTDIILPVVDTQRRPGTFCPQLVVEILAAVEGLSVEDYLASTTPDLEALRRLADFSEEDVLAAALVASDLRPVTVLGILSSEHALEAVAS